jgi:tetratricopeptide (TPR) repeat protein
MGRTDEAIAAGEDAVRLARSGGDASVLAYSLGRLALASIQKGALERARELVAEAEGSVAEPSDTMRAVFQSWRAQLAAASGDLGARLGAFTESARIHERIGDLRRAAGEECNAADVLNRVGAYDEAITALEAARDKCRRVGHRTMEGYALLNLGYALGMRGDHDRALERLDEARAIADAIGEARLAVLADVYRARALLASGRAHEALALADQSASRADELGLATPRIQALTQGSAAALACADPAGALARSSTAYDALLAQGGAEEDEADVYLAHARALRANGRDTDAEATLEAGRARVVALANAIAAEALRSGFSENVAAHRELLVRGRS